MATATKQSETIETIKSVTLDLTLEEARVLAVVLSLVGGDCIDSPRAHAQSVANALYGVGIRWNGAPEENRASGSLRFSDYPAVEG